MAEQRTGGPSGEATEAKVVDREQGMIAIPAQDELQRIDETMASIEKGIVAFKKIKKIALQLTKAKDWVDMGGRPYLDDGGTSNIAVAFGVDIFDLELGPIQWHEDKKGRYYSFDVKGKGHSKRLNRMVEDIGTCSSRDKFFSMVGGQLKEIEEVDMANIKKKAVTNLYGRLIKRLLGIGSVDFDDLSEAGINRSDVPKVTYKGKAQEQPPAGAPPAGQAFTPKNGTPGGQAGEDQKQTPPPAGTDQSQPPTRPQDRTAGRTPSDIKVLDQIQAICTVLAGDGDPSLILRSFSGFTIGKGEQKGEHRETGKFDALSPAWANSVLKKLKDAWTKTRPNEQIPGGMADIR